MRKAILISLVMAMASVLVLGNAGNANSGPLPREVRMGTNPTGSLFNALGAGLASVASKHTPMMVKVVPSGGPVEFLPLMQTKEMDLGVINQFDMWQAFYGKMAYEKPSGGKGFPIRLLQFGCPMSITFAVPKDSLIKTISDVKGKKLSGEYVSHITCHYLNLGLLANAGLTPQDVTIIPVATYTAGVKAVIEGKSDTAQASLGSGVVKELKATRGIRYIPIDPSPAAVKRMQAQFIGSYPDNVAPEKGMEKIWVMAYGICLVARETLSDNAAYEVTKAIWNNYDELRRIHGKLRGWKPEGMANTKATIPYHSGAIKWYKEKGVWTAELEALQADLLSKKK